MGLGTEVVQDISMLAHWVEIFAMSRQCLSRVVTVVIAEAKASSASPTSSGLAETGCRHLGGWVLGRGIALLSKTIVSMLPRVSRPIKPGSVAEWLALVTLVHVPQRMGGSRFKPWFGLGSYRWILGEFSSGVYHMLVH